MGGKAGRGARLKGLSTLTASANADTAGGGDVRVEEVRQVRERVADGGHFPVENSDDARLGLVEDDVVNLVVAVDEAAAVARLAGRVAEEGDHVVVVRDLADGHPAIDILGLRLRFGNGGEGCKLPVEEACGFAEIGHGDGRGRDAVEFSQRADGVVPPVRASVVVS